ncbi:membrane transporter [Mycobacterium leprae Kyoto-2]|uniref:Magnesium transport protein CorA n=4 Tax=Mycobacterium leprae TaxID=1769 RepID=Q9CCA0_MYCLE|nr:magnesium/cobalt transporter CorA [Mycobacterium leprae]CAR71185.1 probable membrane transport protein [Mycobacterium leprae Br4923]AWV49012.1 magnesium and cobalt transport protein CorA [Mycobacterium leprae]OAR21222.1 magnesium and cobalt transport protein CorA [Mycobacterium leprae 3125609]OAX71108.1 magnesium and cobalt transport protein CorA [Mycobacterium leprae 7935681]CAC31471.1 probable membrane transport protein [Mycobacterium leprae]
MFPGFDPLPEALRPVTKPRLYTPHVHPIFPPLTEPLVDCGVYVGGHRLPDKYTTYTAALSRVREIELMGNEGFVWIGLHEPEASHMHNVADVFGLHPLAVEDAVHAHQRPKLERYDDTLFLVLKTVNYVPHESVVLARQIVETGEVMIFVGKNFVVTVRHGEHGELSEVRKRMDTDPEHLRLGSYAVMHAISDYVVDRYLAVTNLMEGDIDAIEEVAFAPGRKLNVEPIYLLKREVIELRRCVAPLSAALQRMQTDNKDLISKELRRYLRDVADHQTEAADQIASYDDMLNSLVQAALARVGMQQNNDMRKMAAWAGIVAMPTMVAAIYGMNFRFMPELNWTWSYPLVMAGMTIVCLVLYWQFRNRNWL